MSLKIPGTALAEALLRTHDLVFASRPNALATEIIMYGPSDMFASRPRMASTGDKAKKLVIMHLLNVKKVRSFPQAGEEEEDAEEFIPERFLDSGSATEIGFKRNDFRFLPFDSGCKMCPGMNFAMANMEVMLANLIHCFDWELPLGQERHDIDMTEMFGIVVHRKQKLLLVPKLHV
ncbi:hypothetical protein PR202_ga20375 [Eleusine coracana subsp. coracana]|uniref:Uncharacterized protein n=1 Tax=Eleusine coracana subsp. coracana TaxID=191504 RepID=A0AAV5CX76_ELECO|nr:hypothetical protein PR202_ga20375 [Eleusine coracana subsp. coracana]